MTEATSFQEEWNKVEGPFPSLTNVLNCQTKEWRQRFASLSGVKRKNVCIQAITIKLPDFFRDFMLQDGVQLPPGTKTSGFLPTSDDADEWSQDGGDAQSTSSSTKAGIYTEMDFTNLNQRIEATIQQLGGSVVPKLNFSTPKDATWMHAGTLKCQTPGDIYLLLKSSDFCAFDVQYAFTQDVVVAQGQEVPPDASYPLHLTLTKWCNLYPSQEFRCFVRNRCMIAISQRHHSQHFPHLMEDATRIRDLIHEFFLDYVQERFPDDKYVVDVYIDKQHRVWIVDFNVWGARTDSLMFGWRELTDMSPCLMKVPEIRCVETSKEVRPDPLSSFRAPIDAVHVANMTGGDAEHFKTLFQDH